jgi:hypothetical protein
MSNKNLRRVIRLIHLIAAASLGLYLYSPIAGDPTLGVIVRFVMIPIIVLTGIALWQQARLNKLINGSTRKPATNAAHPAHTN